MTRYKRQSLDTSTGFLGVPRESRPGPPMKRAPAPPSQLDRRALRRLLSLVGDPPIQFVLWNGEELPQKGASPLKRLHIRDRDTLRRLVINPELHFGDAYTLGTLEVEGDLVEFLEAVYRASRRARQQHPFVRLVWKWLSRARPNTPTGSRENIHHHYNLGNEFFRLWLDEGMVYTCAYFPSPTASLEEAQHAKMDHVCRKLRLQPGESVIEAGCGWGTLALHMARHYGVKVRAYNISSEQIQYARERCAAEGLSGQVDFIEDDYRNISGQCDAFVSVGMLEHVGRPNYQTLGTVVDRCLRPDGRGLIHSIGRDRPFPMNAWIEKRIFPGSYPPTLREMMAIFEPLDFSVQDVENLRLHYAKTLEHWLARFEEHCDEVRGQFDDTFVRAWRLYLAGSLGSFNTGWLQLFQIVFTRSGHNNIPWTRAYLYEHKG